MISLKKISKDYYDQLVEYVNELSSFIDGIGTNKLYSAITQDRFDEWLQFMNSQNATTYMIMDEEEVVGIINIRYNLNQQLQSVGGHIGYNVRPSKRGNGYAAEALKLIYQDAYEHGLDYIYIDCVEGNIASENTMKNAGAEFVKCEYFPDREESIIRYQANIKELVNQDKRVL